MQKIIKRPRVRLILDGEGITLCRGLLRKKCKFLSWSEVKAVGFYVGDMHFNEPDPWGYSYIDYSEYLHTPRDLFLYFSVFTPNGPTREDILPVIREERNICINLGGSEYPVVHTIEWRAETAAEKILPFYTEHIINREAEYYG